MTAPTMVAVDVPPESARVWRRNRADGEGTVNRAVETVGRRTSGVFDGDSEEVLRMRNRGASVRQSEPREAGATDLYTNLSKMSVEERFPLSSMVSVCGASVRPSALKARTFFAYSPDPSDT
jgi:hypothetical protein